MQAFGPASRVGGYAHCQAVTLAGLHYVGIQAYDQPQKGYSVGYEPSYPAGKQHSGSSTDPDLRLIPIDR